MSAKAPKEVEDKMYETRKPPIEIALTEEGTAGKVLNRVYNEDGDDTVILQMFQLNTTDVYKDDFQIEHWVEDRVTIYVKESMATKW